MRILSRYTTTITLSMSLSTSFTRAWKTAGALEWLNDITKYSKCPRWVLKVVFPFIAFPDPVVGTRW